MKKGQKDGELGEPNDMQLEGVREKSDLSDLTALVLVGGLGTRLRSITEVENIPKPMVQIGGGKPFLEYKLEHLRNYGVRNIVLCVSYLAEKVKDYFGDGKNFGLNISYPEEKQLLGTGGAIKNAENYLSEIFLAMNGDTHIDVDIRRLVNAHIRGEEIMTMVVTSATNPLEQELVKCKYNISRGFTEYKVHEIYKRGTEEHANHMKHCSYPLPIPLINAGFYVMEKELLSYIPENQKVSLEQEIFPKFAGKITAFDYSGYFKDLGNPRDLREYREKVKSEGK